MPRFRRSFQNTQIAAELLRKRLTPQEALLWQRLRNRQLAGLKFRRQHPIGPYIVDFCCVESRLIVELDGVSHAEQAEYDAGRSLYLDAAGHRVLRFWNSEIDRELERVLREIAMAGEDPHPPAPSPARRERGSKTRM